MNHCRALLTILFLTGISQLIFLQPSSANEQYITCSSIDNRYTHCRAYTDNQVRLVRQLSSHHCLEGRTWGYDNQGIWVDRGCRAEFIVGYPDRNNDRDHRYGHNNGYDNGRDNRSGHNDGFRPTPPPPVAPPWAVGNFRGKNMRDRTDSSLSISPNGEAVAAWGGQTHRGFFDGRSLRLGNLDFVVQRNGQGFTTILRSDPGNRTDFRRVR